jgi:hypothetical protein
VKSQRSARPLRQSFPIRDRYTVTGHVVGDICFACECRILELAGEEEMVLAWCECGWPNDAAEMEVLG